MTSIQKARAITQTGFFVLFLLAPPLNIFRYDLTLGNFILFGHNWTMQLELFQHGASNATDAALHVLFLGLLPIVLFAATFILIAWRYGRLYCGWLCPHFSVVETINKLMVRASGKPSFWSHRLPEKQADGSIITPRRSYWPAVYIMAVLFAFVWALSLLTYLLPPFEIYSNLIHGTLTRNQSIFLFVATAVFSFDFIFARHLFCRYGCAVGLFQSLAWMSNRRAMVVHFDSQRASACKQCNNACDNACPMRLKARSMKRKMFTCTECGECISACIQVQERVGKESLLDWVSGEAAKQSSDPPATMPDTFHCKQIKV